MINEVAPPGWGHTKAEKEKTKPNKPKSKIGGSAAAFDRARKEGRFKGLPGDKTEKDVKASMFKIMWAAKKKGDKPHYKPGTDKKYKKYQEAVEYFYEEGINEEGLDIVIEEVGLEDFVDFVEERSARKMNVRTKGSIKKQIAKDADAEEKRRKAKTHEYKETPKKKPRVGAPSYSTKVTGAVKKAKAKQPTKKASKEGIRSKIAGAVKKGVERHKSAVKKSKFASGVKSGVKAVGKFAKDVDSVLKVNKKTTVNMQSYEPQLPMIEGKTGTMKKLAKASALDSSDNPKDQDRARAMRVAADFKSWRSQKRKGKVSEVIGSGILKKEELVVEKDLNAAERRALPDKEFALPGKGKGPEGKQAGSYPIPDKNHARMALAMVAKHGTAAKKAKVRAAVAKKFPDIQQEEVGITSSDKMKRAQEKAKRELIQQKAVEKQKKSLKGYSSEDMPDEKSSTKKVVEELTFEGWKDKAKSIMKKVSSKKDAPKHNYGKDAGAEAAKRLRKKDHEKVNFLDPDD